MNKVWFVNNDDIMKFDMESKQNTSMRTSLSYKIAKAFISRNVDSALACADLYREHFIVS